MGSSIALLLTLAGQLSDPMGGGTQPGELETSLIGNASCQLCHRSESDANMAASSYRGTMMDLAGVDPVFLAALEIAANDAPDTAELCLKCHYPRAWLDERTNSDPADGYGLEQYDFEGVQCDLCHRMAVPEPTGQPTTVPPPELSGVLVGNAQFFINDSLQKHGPFESSNSSGHTTAYSPLFEDSVLCAQCHDVSNTFTSRIDDDGSALSQPVPIERTYSEWRASAYADPASPSHKSCMDCHMERYTGVAATAGAPERELRSHRLVGGNTMAPRMVAHLYQGDDVPASLENIAADVEKTVAAARAQLEKAATLEALELIERDGAQWLRVRITNLTGHKLPTGYAEGRRMFLSHDVRFPDGARGPRSGSIDEGTWDFIAGEEPLRTYEILMSEGLAPQHSLHFALVDRLVKDNRIPPLGFSPTSDMPILQHEYPAQPDGSVAHWDEIELPLGEHDECWPALVKVELSFQASSGTYLRFLIENAPLYGPDLAAALEAVGAAPELMESLEVAVFPDGRILPAGTHACEPGGVSEPTPTLDAGPTTTPGNGPDAGAGGDDERGCSCTTASGPAPTPGTLLSALLLGLVCSRARRRQPRARRRRA